MSAPRPISDLISSLVLLPLFPVPSDFINTSQAVTVRIEAAKTSCGFDIACLCKDSSFIETVMSGTTCTPPDVVEFGGLVAKECASKGVTVDVPGGDGGDSGSGGGDGDAEDKPNWGERVTVVDVGMMLGAAGLVALVGL